MTVSKSQIKAQAKYDKANTIQIKLKLNKKTDADIIKYLSDCKNKQGTIYALITHFYLRLYLPIAPQPSFCFFLCQRSCKYRLF